MTVPTMSETNRSMPQAWPTSVNVLPEFPVPLPITQNSGFQDGAADMFQPLWPRFTQIDEKYDGLELLGNGAYGTVYKATSHKDGRLVAIKNIKIEDDLLIGLPSSAMREIALLRGFRHENIVEFIELIFSGPLDLNLVFGYEENDLHRVLKAYRKEDMKMPIDLVKKYTFELFNGLSACHSRLILHRDLKPQNLFIGKDRLRIGDFGLSRTFDLPLQSYTPDVITLWYRAPEILLGAQRYGPEVDVWSAGCIVAEMATGFPIFPGDSEIGTIFKQFQMLGTPTEDAWPGLSALVNWKSSFPKWPATDLSKILASRPEMGQEGIDLLRGLLSWHPPTRIKAQDGKKANFMRDALAPT